MTVNIETRTVEFKDVYVRQSSIIAKVDDVLNALTVLLCSEKPAVPITNSSVAEYLSSNQLISQVAPGSYAVKDEAGCSALSDSLSDYMDNLLTSFCQA